MAVKKDQVLSQTANLQQGIINNNPVRFNEEHYDVDRDPTDNKRPLSTSAGDSPGTGGVDINSLGLDKKADLVNGKVPEDQLPSYVDDVLEYADLSSFPAEGESGKIYVALDTNITYRWSGSAYVQVGPEGDIVIANPTLVGNEADLEGLQVGNTKYKVESGVFIATFNSTHYGDMISAVNDGKIVICIKDNKVYYYSGYYNSSYIFFHCINRNVNNNITTYTLSGLSCSSSNAWMEISEKNIIPNKLYKHRLKFSCYYNSSSKVYVYIDIVSSSSSELPANVIKNYVDQTSSTFMYSSNFTNGCSIINVYFEWSNNAIRGNILITEYDFTDNTTSIITKNRETITFIDDYISEI